MPRPPLLYPVLDAQGLLRFPPPWASQILQQNTPFASLFTDPLGQRVAIAFSSTAQPGSFQLLNPGGRLALYLKSAFQAAHLSVDPGPVELVWDQHLLIATRLGNSATQTGAWNPLHCRSSARIPMVSLDTRGNLSLDRLCLEALQPGPSLSAEAHYQAGSGVFTVAFHSEGPLAVRIISSHAEISFRGTLSFLGIPLPQKRVRYTAKIKPESLEFCLKDPFLPTRS